jgi:hypothetical protein
MKEKLVAAFVLVSFVGWPLAVSAGSSAQPSLSAGTTGPASSPTSGVHVFPASSKRPLSHGGLPTKSVSSPPLLYHGGPVITSAHVVYIFWGPSFNNIASPDYGYAQTLQSFRNQFGTAPEYATLTQYSGIGLTNLGAGTADWFDVSTPPTNVTDAIAQGEVSAYLSTHTFDASAIYEVVLPSASYSSMSSTSTSCGGPALIYCAYHGFFTNEAPPQTAEACRRGSGRAVTS